MGETFVLAAWCPRGLHSVDFQLLNWFAIRILRSTSCRRCWLMCWILWEKMWRRGISKEANCHWYYSGLPKFPSFNSKVKMVLWACKMLALLRRSNSMRRNRFGSHFSRSFKAPSELTFRQAAHTNMFRLLQWRAMLYLEGKNREFRLVVVDV